MKMRLDNAEYPVDEQMVYQLQELNSNLLEMNTIARLNLLRETNPEQYLEKVLHFAKAAREAALKRAKANKDEEDIKVLERESDMAWAHWGINDMIQEHMCDNI